MGTGGRIAGSLVGLGVVGVEIRKMESAVGEELLDRLEKAETPVLMVVALVWLVGIMLLVFIGRKGQVGRKEILTVRCCDRPAVFLEKVS